MEDNYQEKISLDKLADLGQLGKKTLLRRFKKSTGETPQIYVQKLRIETAKRLLRLHPLRGADALQLAAALTVAQNDPSSIGFVTLDMRLRDAASRQGFTVTVP